MTVDEMRAPAGAAESPNRPKGLERVIELPSLNDRLGESV